MPEKELPQDVEHARSVPSGRHPNREQIAQRRADVASLREQGLNSSDIARHLDIPVTTVRNDFTAMRVAKSRTARSSEETTMPTLSSLSEQTAMTEPDMPLMEEQDFLPKQGQERTVFVDKRLQRLRIHTNYVLFGLKQGLEEGEILKAFNSSIEVDLVGEMEQQDIQRIKNVIRRNR